MPGVRMIIKSYFARSVQEAMEKARVEIGPDAMLMDSKKTSPDLKHLGSHEVVFGIPENSPYHTRNLQKPSTSAEPSNAVLQELATLRKQIESIKTSVSVQPLRAASSRKRKPEVVQLCDRLLAAGFSEAITRELVEEVEERFTSAEPAEPDSGVKSKKRKPRAVLRPDLLHNVLSQCISERLRRRFGHERDTNGRTIMLVGPPGVGKTTSLVKLAIKYGISVGKSVQILTTDTLRVGASDQLEAYAQIIGVGFQTIHTMAGLLQALNEHRSKDMMFIDTPGFAPANMDEAAEWAAVLSSNNEIEVHLVMPATLHHTAATRVSDRFAAFNPKKLLVTHFDEAETSASVLQQALQTTLPISYIATGQQIPDDIEEVSEAELIDNLIGSLQLATASAA